MRRFTRREEKIRCRWALICVAMSFLMSVSCFPPRVERQYIEPLGLYFHMQRKDTTVMISFGEKEALTYPNYYEIYESRECGGSSCYFVVDNTSGTPKIKHIFFEPMVFHDIHIPYYPYSIDYFVTQDFNSFRVHLEKLTKIDRDSAVFPDRYVVQVWPAAYDRYLDYWIYDLGDVEDMEGFITSFVDNPRVRTYPNEQEMWQKLDYKENTINYGEPAVCKRFTVSDGNRKEMIKVGWLFLDTLDIIDEPVLEIDKWKVDDHILSVIYRIGADGERTPVKGARYVYAMERDKRRIYYQ